MSLFPDRTLVSTSSRELALISPSLTEDQKRQLSSVTEGYLKDHGLIGYENTRAVLPVIKQCVLDGLNKSTQIILPSDDLSFAFKLGYRARTSLINTMAAELDELSGEMRLEGALAMPQDLITSASKELRSRVFLPNLIAGQEVFEIAKIRRPIFRKLVGYGRDCVELDIPGSKQVVLTPRQEAGLIRHLVFGWVVYGEPKLLLETQDFMTYKQVYLERITKEGDTLWKQLAQLSGQDSPQAIAYLKDMSTQLADILSTVPDKPAPSEDALTIATSIDTAFKSLEQHFLVVNPFNKLTSLSENPDDKGKSIWDKDKTTILDINGVAQRVPTIHTLNLAAYLISDKAPQRAAEYRSGGNRIAGLLEEVTRQSNDATIPDLSNEIERGKKSLEKMRKIITAGGIPIEAAVPHSGVLKLAQNQSDLMLDEIQFICALRDYRNRFVDLGLKLLQTYRDGAPLKSEGDYNDMLTVVYSPGVLGRRTNYFATERIAKRVRSLEDLLVYENFADAMMSEATSDHSKTRFRESLDVTILDILTLRNKFWVNQYFKQTPELSPDRLGVAWAGILHQEIRRIENEAWREANGKVADKSPERIESQKNKILKDADNPLSRKYAHAMQLQAELEAGIIPSDEALFQNYLELWRLHGKQRITRAMYEWTDEERITTSLEDKLNKVKLPIKKLGNPQSLRMKAHEPNGPLAIILDALSRICPDQLLPDSPIKIEDLAHRTSVFDPDSPFSPWRPGFVSTKQLDEKRRILYGRFQEWLASNGVYLGETFRALIKPAAMSALGHNGLTYQRLFGIEEELQTWYKNQREKLTAQVENYSPGFYNTSPTAFVRRQELALSSKNLRLHRLESRNKARLESRVHELQQLNLIRSEVLK